MDELKFGRLDYKTSSSLQTPSNFMKTYRELQILNANLMNIYAPFVLPATQWTFMLVSVFTIYGFIKLSGLVAFVMCVTAIAIVIFLLVMFTVLAEVEVRSREALISWRCHSESKILRTFLRSTKSIRFYVGTFYYVDSAMVLTMLKFIIECTVDLIMLN
ncbi:unnamed protein product [Allacma fusca]|uniref:Uncharacterized protein n=1 Tax=Allacma fusca TaxID=39272 RepID=A0A8J2NTC3_9HEXA|nr:unnamed protein product [Allacma fusca]